MTTRYPEDAAAARAGDPDEGPRADDEERALVHQFIRLFGHRPSLDELDRYRSAHAGVAVHLPARLRRGAARLITRL